MVRNRKQIETTQAYSMEIRPTQEHVDEVANNLTKRNIEAVTTGNLYKFEVQIIA